MARQLAIGLHGGGNIAMRADGPEEAIAFDGLGGLLCLNPDEAEDGFADAELVAPDRMPEGRHALQTTPLTESAYAPDWSRVLIACRKKTTRRPHYSNCCVWQKLLIYAGLNAILRGENAVLAHCAALETDRGAVLLFGESGMGKSTASARWRANGGKCVSDDMALLDFSGSDGVVRVRRMPTWSACREAQNEWNYPAGEELPLAGVLALGRSESGRDGIIPLSPARFFAQCYRSLFYWNLFYAKELPEEKQRILTERIRTQAETITKRFAPRALLPALEGDLKKVIEDAI
ncbi:MAG: hypothetical protein IJT68_02975 [Lentisphaeria bacterium]|nr:hypothetical protein [Lentisphaeria bacterium]MBR3506625.1 hypothetical protein [Lentisphaeria bacterium]